MYNPPPYSIAIHLYESMLEELGIIMQQLFLDANSRRLLRLLRERGISYIDSVVEKGAIRFPEVESELELDTDGVARVIESLEKSGVLERIVERSLYSCPECGDACFQVKTACSSCGSPELLVGQVIEHLTCGHIDFDNAFLWEDRLRCPKCGRHLRAIGVDYRRIGRAFKCLKCGAISPVANELYRCRNCGSENIKDKLKILHLHRFKVNKEALSSIGDVPEKLYLLSRNLESEGIIVEFDKSVKGSSGVYHTFTLSIKYPGSGDGSPDLVMDIVPMDDPSKRKSEVLAFYVKAIDVPIGRKALAVYPKIGEEFRKLLSTIRVELIEAENFDLLVDKISEHIRNGEKPINLGKNLGKLK